MNKIIFIQEETTGPIYITITKTNVDVLNLLQKGNHRTLYLLLNVPSSYQMKQIHRIIKHLNIRGHWYEADPLIFSFIEELRKDPTYKGLTKRSKAYATRDWTDEKLDFLRKHYRTGTKKFLCQGIGKTWGPIKRKASRMGLYRE